MKCILGRPRGPSSTTWSSEYLKVGQDIQEWTKQNLRKSDMVCLGRAYHHFKFFKGCLPQILLGPFLNSLNINMKRFKRLNFAHKG